MLQPLCNLKNEHVSSISQRVLASQRSALQHINKQHMVNSTSVAATAWYAPPPRCHKGMTIKGDHPEPLLLAFTLSVLAMRPAVGGFVWLHSTAPVVVYANCSLSASGGVTHTSLEFQIFTQCSPYNSGKAMQQPDLHRCAGKNVTTVTN